MVKTLKKMLQKFVSYTGRDWECCLHYCSLLTMKCHMPQLESPYWVSVWLGCSKATRPVVEEQGGFRVNKKLRGDPGCPAVERQAHAVPRGSREIPASRKKKT